MLRLVSPRLLRFRGGTRSSKIVVVVLEPCAIAEGVHVRFGMAQKAAGGRKWKMYATSSSHEAWDAAHEAHPREARERKVRNLGLERWRAAKGRQNQPEPGQSRESAIPERWLEAIGMPDPQEWIQQDQVGGAVEYRRNSEIHSTAARGRKLVLDSLNNAGNDEPMEVQVLPEGSPANMCYRMGDEGSQEMKSDSWFGLSVRTTKTMKRKGRREEMVACFTVGKSFCELDPLNRQIMVFVALEEGRLWVIPAKKIQGMRFLEIVEGGKWSDMEVSPTDLADHLAEITYLLGDVLWSQSAKDWKKITSVAASKGVQNSNALNHFLELLLNKCNVRASFEHVISIKGYTYNVIAYVDGRRIRIQDATASRVKDQHGLLVSLRKNGGRSVDGHRRTLQPFHVDDFDLLRVSLPGAMPDGTPDQGDAKLAFMYLIPAKALQDRGYLSSLESRGKVSLRLYPHETPSRTSGPAPDRWANEYLIHSDEDDNGTKEYVSDLVAKVRSILQTAG